jgi:hypothetical protein
LELNVGGVHPRPERGPDATKLLVARDVAGAGPLVAENQAGHLDLEVKNRDAGPPGPRGPDGVLDSVVRGVFGVLDTVVSDVVGVLGSVVMGAGEGAGRNAPHPGVELELPPLAH